VTVASGWILLLVLAGLVAYVVARASRRMGIRVTGRTWLMVMTGFVVVMLVLWALAQH
jgi:hypothetical protein